MYRCHGSNTTNYVREIECEETFHLLMVEEGGGKKVHMHDETCVVV